MSQDIHICGSCRAKFADILEFLKHKKDCCNRGSNNVFPQSLQSIKPAKEESTHQSNFRRQSHTDKISTDDIAVFIVSPKSFASPRLVAKSYDAAFNESNEQKHRCPTEKSVSVQASLSETSDVYYENNLPSGSTTSTPCPEDLEVGQISASVLGQKPLDAPQNSVRTFRDGKSCCLTTTGDIPSSSCNLAAPVESVTSSSSIAEPSQRQSKRLLSYIRQNTASAPTVVGSSRERMKRRVSLEKRERLQGLSDDLLESSYTVEQTALQTASSSCHQFQMNLPKAKSFKAVFTSPSRSGHRLSPTQDLELRSSESAEGSKNILGTLVHSKLTRGSPSNRRAMVYKNISAAVKSQRLLGSSELERKLTTKPDAQKYHMIKRVGRKIMFERTCAESLVLQSKTASHSSSILNRNNANNQYCSHQMSLSKEEPSYVSVDSVKEGNVALISPLKTPTSTWQTQCGFSTNNPVTTPGSVTCTNSSITTVTAALKQQIPTAFISTETPQSNQRDTTTVEVPSTYHQNTQSSQDSIIVYRDGDANFVIMPENIQNGHSFQQKEVGPAHQQLSSNKKVVSLSLTSKSVKHIKFVSGVEQRQQLQHEQTQTACHNVGENNHWSTKVSNTRFGPNVDCNISSQNETDQTNSTHPVMYMSTSQASVSCTVPTMVSSVNAADPTKVINDTGSSLVPVKSNAVKEPCIIRQKNISMKSNATGGIASQSQPKYEINGATINDDGSKTERLFICKFDKCRYSSRLYKDFRRHYRIHTGERPYQCQQCGKTFTRSDKLRTHQRGHEGAKPYECNLCDYKALESGSLKKHLRIHSDERPYKCQICPYASRNSSHLIVHLRSHTGDAPFVCSECGAQFRISTDLKRHLRTHTGEKPFKCVLCDYKCAHKGNLKSHMRINHSKEDEVSCDQCDFSTSSRKRLKEHMMTHDPSRLFKCQQCPLTFPSARALRAHLCTHDSVKPYQCSYCPFACKRSGNLKKHVQCQHLDKLQRASGKQKAKKRATDVKAPPGNHSQIKAKTGRRVEYDKQHKCPQCGCGFVRLDSLNSHMNQHKREEGQNQRAQMGDTKLRISPSMAPISSSQPHLYRMVRNTTVRGGPTFPPTLKKQGMKHIAAAASKLFEENFASTKQMPRTDSSVKVEENSRPMEPQNVSLVPMQAIKVPQSFSGNINDNEIDNDKELKKPMDVSPPVRYQQLPWEHSSYTLSLQPDVKSNYMDHIDNPSHALDPSVSSKQGGAHSNVVCRLTQALPKSVSYSPEYMPKESLKMKSTPFDICEETAEKQKNHMMLNAVCQPGDQNSGMPSGHWLQVEDKPQQLQQPVHITVQPSQNATSITHVELDVNGQPFIFSQQGEKLNSQETSYNFQLVPQMLAPAQQLVRQIILPPTQVQPQPHIQIVLPGASVSGQSSSQTISLPSTQQQIFLQDCGTNKVEVVSLPYSQMPLASTPGQNTKVFQTVTSTGVITFEPEQVQHAKPLGQGSHNGNGHRNITDRSNDKR